MTVITITELKNNLKKYTDMAQTEDVIITKHGRPFIKIEHYENELLETVNALAGCIRLDKTYEEIMDERYEEMLRR